MSKLIEISLENGAREWLGNDDRDLPKVLLTHAQFHATVEQICNPLANNLQELLVIIAEYRKLGLILDANEIEKVSSASEAINTYLTTMEK